jgi:hypothetical protein
MESRQAHQGAYRRTDIADEKKFRQDGRTVRDE